MWNNISLVATQLCSVRNPQIWLVLSSFSILRCGFPLAVERMKRKTFFPHTAWSLNTSVRGFQVTRLVQGSVFVLPSYIAWHAPPTHPPMKYFHSLLCYSEFIFLPLFCTIVRQLSYAVKLIKVRLRGSAWHVSQRYVRKSQVVWFGMVRLGMAPSGMWERVISVEELLADSYPAKIWCGWLSDR